MIYCESCHQWSTEQHECRYCGKSYRSGYLVPNKIKNKRCDYCDKYLPYGEDVWKVQDSYFHIGCYKRNIHNHVGEETDQYEDETEVNVTEDDVAEDDENSDDLSYDSSEILDVDSQEVEEIDDIAPDKWPDLDDITLSFASFENNISHKRLENLEIIFDGLQRLRIAIEADMALPR